jgi:hypothetical protein
MPELERILDENRSPFVGRAGTITFHECVQPISITPEQQKTVDQCWDDAQQRNATLFDGKIISYAGHNQRDGTLCINYFITSYKYALAQLHNPSLNFGIKPLAVSGILIDPQQNTLLARRAPIVTQYPGWYELVPSGGISGDKAANGTIAYQQQLVQELTEETGIPADRIVSITPLGLVFEKDYGVYVIANVINLKESLEAHRDALLHEEYSAWSIMPRGALPDFFSRNPTVPTSKTIAQAVLAPNP